MESEINKTVIGDELVKFHHMYNGLIFEEDCVQSMLEFRVEYKTTDSISFVVFDDVNSHRGWFHILSTDKEKCIIGPIHLNTKLIETYIYQIDDERYPLLHGKNIESLSNDKSCMIDHTEVPEWIYRHLVSKLKIIYKE